MHNKFPRVLISLFIIFLILIVAFLSCRMLFPRKHYDLIDKYCDEFNLSPHLVLSLIKAESNFNESAVSSANAKGLMQLTDSTFSYCMESLSCEGDIFSAEDNIRAGVWYLSFLLEKYDGNEKNAVAAYNAGETNVDSWLSDSRYSSDGKTLDSIPFGETDRHTKKIARYSIIYKLLYPVK